MVGARGSEQREEKRGARLDRGWRDRAASAWGGMGRGGWCGRRMGIEREVSRRRDGGGGGWRRDDEGGGGGEMARQRLHLRDGLCCTGRYLGGSP